MTKGKSAGKAGTILPLLLIYAGCVFIRYLLATVTTNFPTVYIDEFLYYSMGRSIATEGTLLYYGQPATYNFIVYPLLISPVYKLFGNGANYYRILQVWNIMLMSLAVFPIHGLCKAMVQKKNTALWLTGLFMLLPDFILGQFIFSETVIYPLFYALMYCVYRSTKQNTLKYSLWIGVLGALIYYTKPGAVVPAALAMVLLAGGAVRRKDRKAGLNTLAGVAAFAAVFFLFKLLAELVFGYQGTLLSIYHDQAIGYNEINHDYFYRTMAQYPYYILLACGILPFLVSLTRYPGYEKEDRRYWLFLAVCVLMIVIGTAWAVNRPERKDILYLRYMEMYFPLFFLFCLLPQDEKKTVSDRGRKVTMVLGCLLLAYIVVSTILWGSTTGVTQGHDTHFLISLAALFTKDIKWTANIIIFLLCGGTLYLLLAKSRKRELVTKICCAVYLVMILLNNTAAYSSIGENTNVRLAQETDSIHKGLGGREYLHVCAPDQCDYGLDVNTQHNIIRIQADDFVRNIQENNGVYVPFVPASTRGMTAVRKTPDTDTLVVDENVFQNIHFSDNATTYISTYNSFEIVVFRQGERIVDSVLTGSRYPAVEADSPCRLRVYNETLIGRPVKVRLEIESAADQTLEFSTDGTGFHTIPVTAGRYWYDLSVGTGTAEYTIIFPSGSVKLHEYEVVLQEETGGA